MNIEDVHSAFHHAKVILYQITEKFDPEVIEQSDEWKRTEGGGGEIICFREWLIS